MFTLHWCIKTLFSSEWMDAWIFPYCNLVNLCSVSWSWITSWVKGYAPSWVNHEKWCGFKMTVYGHTTVYCVFILLFSLNGFKINQYSIDFGLSSSILLSLLTFYYLLNLKYIYIFFFFIHQCLWNIYFFGHCSKAIKSKSSYWSKIIRSGLQQYYLKAHINKICINNKINQALTMMSFFLLMWFLPKSMFVLRQSRHWSRTGIPQNPCGKSQWFVSVGFAVLQSEMFAMGNAFVCSVNINSLQMGPFRSVHFIN